MLTSKQRAQLRALANTMETIVQIGKGGIVDTLIKQIDDVLLKRELIKMKVHETCELTAREVCGIICEKINAEPVQVIGSKIVIYRANPKKKKEERIVLVK